MSQKTIPTLSWKIGVEIELLAPLGSSRYELASAISEQSGGSVKRFFHPQSEPSKVEGAPVFENLTLGFEVVDAEGQLLARCVDDLTLQKDLQRSRSPQAGWYRIISDDSRFLRLIMQQVDAKDSCQQVLEPMARLFNSTLAVNPDGMTRLSDDRGFSIAIATPLPGERERPCELITPPIAENHLERLQALLSAANELAFYAPIEGATHIHFDATRLCSASVLANLVKLLWVHGAGLRQLVGANPNCTRLGNWPIALHELVQSPDFLGLSWEEVKACLSEVKLSKFCDFNLKNLLDETSDKHTFEVRIFPVLLDAESIIKAAGLFEAILNWALSTDNSDALPVDIESLLECLPLSANLRDCWLERLHKIPSSMPL